jgi:sugar O-acyltransferase (sialic acid O-acetyltransferase NeuD family)
MSKQIILIGGGGHCKVCIDVIEQGGKYEIHGILDKEESKGDKVLGYEIIGTDELIPSLVEKDYAFLITVGQIKSALVRKKIFDELTKLNADIVTVISPNAYVSKYANVERGTIIMHGVNVNAGASVGENNIINTGSIIEHDVKTGKHCHISTNAVVNGDCVIGNESFIGSNATVINGIHVTDQVVIGAGTLVNKNIEQSGTYIGNPVQKYESK